MNSKKSFLCIDIGNTTTHIGKFVNDQLLLDFRISTKNLRRELLALHEIMDSNFPVSYCSVVPKAEAILHNLLVKKKISSFNLNHKTNTKLPICYPNPLEIGQDRIANSLAVYLKHELPCVIIDVGTATTFDIIFNKQGYIGGVIAPGPQGFLDFLHQNTAQLPKLNITDDKMSAIGKSTAQAMQLGVKYGYPAMVNGILNQIEKSYNDSVNQLNIIYTGGGQNIIKNKSNHYSPNLTLEGLALAFQLNNS